MVIGLSTLPAHACACECIPSTLICAINVHIIICRTYDIDIRYPCLSPSQKVEPLAHTLTLALNHLASRLAPVPSSVTQLYSLIARVAAV